MKNPLDTRWPLDAKQLTSSFACRQWLMLGKPCLDLSYHTITWDWIGMNSDPMYKLIHQFMTSVFKLWSVVKKQKYVTIFVGNQNGMYCQITVVLLLIILTLTQLNILISSLLELMCQNSKKNKPKTPNPTDHSKVWYCALLIYWCVNIKMSGQSKAELNITTYIIYQACALEIVKMIRNWLFITLAQAH